MPHRTGRTCWKRFATVLVCGVTAAAALGIGMAQGALAASFFISGQSFQVRAGTLYAHGLSTYPMVDVTRKGTLVPVVVLGFRRAEIRRLCLSVELPVPTLGTYTLLLTGGRGRHVQAANLYIDATSVSAAQADTDGIDIGIAAGSMTKGPVNPGDRRSRFFDPDVFAQQADSAVLTDVKATSVAVSAGTLNIPDFDLQVEQGSHDCF
ncbi:DUF6230 family protein [Streptomyces sp. NPDC048664]|uniref:DUF6230 family protein n=1 Tax=Streptomyces sp. NPDC048664 TaxID=3154505 RepID=UPI003415B196